MKPVFPDMVRLELILRELRQAVLACDAEGKILFFNPAAQQLFQNPGTLVLGGSVFALCGRAPLEYTFCLLLQSQTRKKQRSEAVLSRFSCTTLKDSRPLLCSMNLISGPKNQPPFFILTFEETGPILTNAIQLSRLVERTIVDLRGPLANLCAAAENLQAHPEMGEAMRDAFEEVMITESAVLKQHFDTLVTDARSLPPTPWPLNDVYSADLFQSVVRSLPPEGLLQVTMTGVPLWMQVDSYTLTMVLLFLLARLRETLGISEVDMEALLGDRRVYLDIVWQGQPVNAATLNSWLPLSLSDPLVGMTIGEVLFLHGSEIWSQSHRRQGYSLLRLSAPISPRQWQKPAVRLRQQPVYYDFSLLDQSVDLGELGDRPLDSLTYVVFDTETTSLSPQDGGEILSLAAVRVQGQRILTAESFSTLVKTEHPLPAETLAIYGITSDSLQDKPRIEEVLQEFVSFVGGAVLVAHNAAFDLQFLHFFADRAGVKCNQPLLDTLLLALVTTPEWSDHTLTGLGKKLGLETQGGVTSLDGPLFTAQIFVKLQEVLQENGIFTLAAAVAASKLAQNKGHE